MHAMAVRGQDRRLIGFMMKLLRQTDHCQIPATRGRMDARWDQGRPPLCRDTIPRVCGQPSAGRYRCDTDRIPLGVETGIREFTPVNRSPLTLRTDVFPADSVSI